MTKRIMIHAPRPGSPLSVTPDSQPLGKSSGDSVVWDCDTGCQFSVEFVAGSPFENSHFDNGHNNSGLVRGNADKRSYKYKVTVGSDTLDPQIIVN